VQTDRIINTVLDHRYRIERLLGAGGMGMVYLGEHVRTGRKCAVKLLLPEAANDLEAVQRFEREARVLGALGHPGIVGVHDFSETSDGRPFFVMDYLKGEDLAQRLDRVGFLGWEETKKIVDEVSAALWAAHQAGVLHRDLKPGNVFLAQSPAAPERVVLLDFGLAKGGVTNSMTLTHSNMVMGTPLYMSPEQARSVGVDARSDLYSLAAMTYELLAGQPPFVGPNFTAVLAMLLTEQPRKVSARASVGAAVPGHMDEVLDIALSKEPQDRQPDVASFATAVLQRRPAWADTTEQSIESGVSPREGRVGVATGPPAVQDSASLQLAATVSSSPPVAAAAVVGADVNADPRMAATVASNPALAPAATHTATHAVTLMAVSDSGASGVPGATMDPAPTPVGTKAAGRRRLPVMPVVIVTLLVLAGVGAALAYWAGQRGSQPAAATDAGVSAPKVLAPLDAAALVGVTPDAMAASGAPDGGTQPEGESPLVGEVNKGLKTFTKALDGLGAQTVKAGKRVVRNVVRGSKSSPARAMAPPMREPAPMGRAASVVPPARPPAAMQVPQATKDLMTLGAYMQRRDYKGCIRAAARMSPRPQMLGLKLGCIVATRNYSLAVKDCHKYLGRFPSSSYARNCRNLIRLRTKAAKQKKAWKAKQEANRKRRQQRREAVEKRRRERQEKRDQRRRR